MAQRVGSTAGQRRQGWDFAITAVDAGEIIKNGSDIFEGLLELQAPSYSATSTLETNGIGDGWISKLPHLVPKIWEA